MQIEHLPRSVSNFRHSPSTCSSAHSCVFAARCVSGPGDFSGRFFWMVLRFVAQPGVEHVKVWVLDGIKELAARWTGSIRLFILMAFHKWGNPQIPQMLMENPSINKWNKWVAPNQSDLSRKTKLIPRPSSRQLRIAI